MLFWGIDLGTRMNHGSLVMNLSIRTQQGTERPGRQEIRAHQEPVHTMGLFSPYCQGHEAT